MRAMTVLTAGAPLSLVERPEPLVQANTVLLRVRACGVCYRDLIDRKGLYLREFPRILGHEIAGEVVASGPGVTGFSPGDRVIVRHRPDCGDCFACREGEDARCERGTWACGLTVDGGYAEFCLAHARSLVHVPTELSLQKASFLHCTAAVARRALFHRGRLAFGESVLITGASGGVGVHALQLARLAGARTIAVTSNESKVGSLRKYGAHDVVVSTDGRFQKEVLGFTNGRGVDLALELTGKPTWSGSSRSVRRGGRIVLVGNVLADRLGEDRIEHVDFNPGRAIVQELEIIGSQGASRRDSEHVLALAARHDLEPVLAGILPLDRAADAHEMLLTRGVIGRLVLTP